VGQASRPVSPGDPFSANVRQTFGRLPSTSIDSLYRKSHITKRKRPAIHPLSANRTLPKSPNIDLPNEPSPIFGHSGQALIPNLAAVEPVLPSPSCYHEINP
jgi:hypothetical protein